MKPVYYNEFDKQKAAWLRELIARNLIAPGDVDERSIADVRSDDLRGYRQCHFFAGIGVWSYALRLAGWEDDCEVWTGSCPCQPFSAAGKGEAFDDERHLWPVWFPLIDARRPVVCFGEQVASIDGLAWFDAAQTDLDRARYTVGALDLCAAGFGAPEIRQRLFFVAESSSFQRGSRRIGETSDEGGQAFGGHARGGSRSCGDAGGVGHTDGSERRPGDGEPRRHGQALRREQGADRAGESGATGGLANADRLLPEQSAWERTGPAEAGGGWTRDQSPGRGPVNGFWRDADWVLTRPQRVGDRPSLRPVEPGSFPLVNGAPARVGRLRGYGDGIVAEVAAAFIRAYMEFRGLI